MGEIWDRNQNDKKWKISIFLHKIICCGCVLESPRWGDSNTHPEHMILWRTYDNSGKNTGVLWKHEYGDVHVMLRMIKIQMERHLSWWQILTVLVSSQTVCFNVHFLGLTFRCHAKYAVSVSFWANNIPKSIVSGVLIVHDIDNIIDHDT